MLRPGTLAAYVCRPQRTHGDKEMNNSLVQTIFVLSLALVAFAVPSMSQEKKGRRFGAQDRSFR
jgi:hypothetical protein